PKHKPIHIHSFIYYTSLMLLNFHSLDGVWEIRRMPGRKNETGKQRISTLSRSAPYVSGDRPCNQIFLCFASDST
ncbi:hypothetical protein QUA54_24570, partial [Microcoleus sp. MOSTC5]